MISKRIRSKLSTDVQQGHPADVLQRPLTFSIWWLVRDCRSAMKDDHIQSDEKILGDNDLLMRWATMRMKSVKVVAD